MEPHRNLRVLPSNVPTLSEDVNSVSTAGQGLRTSPQTCPKFNSGLDCRVCELLHACSTCLDDDHGAQTCEKGARRPNPANNDSSKLAHSSSNYDAAPSVEFDTKMSHILLKSSSYSGCSTIKSEHRRRQRFVDQGVADSLEHLPLFYRSELLSPRYLDYRKKSRSKGLSQKWPDHVEEAFQEGTHVAGFEIIITHMNSVEIVPLSRPGEATARRQIGWW